MNETIRKAKEKALRGETLERDEIIELLDIPIGSEDDKELRKAARDVAEIVTDNTAYIWTAIGADFETCPMNCEFCSLGEKWGIIKDKKKYSEEEILTIAEKFVNEGSNFIVLRTTEYYSLEKLGRLAKKMRDEIKGNYDIILNTGEISDSNADRLAESGVDGMYHALRLGEGVTTPFDPETRLSTMKSIGGSKLDLISLVEPVGREHTNAELADRFITTVETGAYISGAMARVPVKGTPFGNDEMIDEHHLAHIIAAFRLSGGSTVKNICVHPHSQEAAESGANVAVVEMGAIPRDDKLINDNWECFGIVDAGKMFMDAGYKLSSRREER
ncbi:MAG: radical SAM protein [Eubacteriaceae bacterium]|nr:radical SAM protein [Eubacteriaceae bacterium]